MRSKREPGSSFEETYPRYAFSELVRWGITLGGWMRRLRKSSATTEATPPVSRRPPGTLPVIRIPPAPRLRDETEPGAAGNSPPSLDRDTRKSA